jgi:hypothetical protein
MKTLACIVFIVCLGISGMSMAAGGGGGGAGAGAGGGGAGGGGAGGGGAGGGGAGGGGAGAGGAGGGGAGGGGAGAGGAGGGGAGAGGAGAGGAGAGASGGGAGGGGGAGIGYSGVAAAMGRAGRGRWYGGEMGYFHWGWTYHHHPRQLAYSHHHNTARLKRKAVGYGMASEETRSERSRHFRHTARGEEITHQDALPAIQRIPGDTTDILSPGTPLLGLDPRRPSTWELYSEMLPPIFSEAPTATSEKSSPPGRTDKGPGM